MKITIKGIGDETLTQQHFIAKGGEGSIYGKGDTAYKIYEDPSKMIPAGKMTELSVLNDPRIIKPERTVLDPKTQERVGYTMKWKRDTHPLVQLFSRAFQQRNQITPAMTLELTKELYEIVSFVHSKSILIVDLNELNFLSENKFKELYAIDVNGYQTQSYPAMAIMDSIRDRHCKNNQWSTGTDWFSWSVLAVQLILGIHPYKGKHPQFESLPMDQRLEARMKANVSIFHPGTTIPAVVAPFSVIPDGLRNYLIAVFEKGIRDVPPQDFKKGGVTAPTVKQLHGSNLFVIDLIREFTDEIMSVKTSEGTRVVITKTALYINQRKQGLPCATAKIGFSPKMNKPVLAHLESGTVKLFDSEAQKEINFYSSASALMESAGRLYIQNGTQILEIQLVEIAQLIASVKHVGNALDLPGATQVYDGCLIQNLLGKWFTSVFPSAGKCAQMKLDELDNYTIIDAKFERNILVVVGVQKSGIYDRLVFRFSPDLMTRDVRTVKNITHTGLNFTVSDAGVCVLMNEDEKLEVFANKPNSTLNIFDDPAITGDMRLFHEGAKILFAQGKRLCSMTMKKKP